MQETTFEVQDLQTKSSVRLDNDFGMTSLTLDVTFKTAYNNYNINYNKKDMEIKATIKSKCNLKTDLEKAMFNEELSDFAFVFGNEKIYVSKFILSARSPVFNKQFHSEFKEKQENQQISDSSFSKEAFMELIRYIYIGEVLDLDTHVSELLYASDYYEIDSLKMICEEKLLKILNENNANDIFQCAHLYRCSDELKKAAFELIKKIFNANNYKISPAFLNNPSKVLRLFEIKDTLESELSEEAVSESVNESSINGLPKSNPREIAALAKRLGSRLNFN